MLQKAKGEKRVGQSVVPEVNLRRLEVGKHSNVVVDTFESKRHIMYICVK